MTDTIITLRETLKIASLIQDTVGISTEVGSTSNIMVLPTLASPTPLTSELIELGLPSSVATRISDAYLRDVEEFKTTTQKIIHNTCTRLASLPRHSDQTPLEDLYNQIIDAYRQRYTTTVEHCAIQAQKLALSHLSSISKSASAPCITPLIHASKKKRHFKTEYLPLFEFAFEKDRFPNREDKRQLAKISGMSYRQVCVWFQNRRCRYSSRVKSHNLTPPPQTFEEMKARLTASARDTLSKIPTTSQETPKLLAHVSSSSISTVQDVRGPRVLACGSKDKGTAPTRSRARSQGILEISDSEERGEFGVDNDMHNIPQLTSTSSYSPELVLRPLNPLNPYKPTTANAFPAVYKPSKPTSNPFVVEPQTWLRDTQAPGTAQVIDPTSEVLESIMERFDKMEVDVPMSNSDSSSGSLTTHKDPVPLALPHTKFLSLRTSLNSHISMPRTFSSGSSVSWSSDASTPSRSVSYSTAPSSVLSSPNHSEICLPNQSECEIAPSRLTAPSSSADEESTCHTPVDEVASRAVPFDTSSIKPASKVRVDEWVSGVSTQPEDDHAAKKWQQLLAAAAAEASPAT